MLLGAVEVRHVVHVYAKNVATACITFFLSLYFLISLGFYF